MATRRRGGPSDHPLPVPHHARHPQPVPRHRAHRRQRPHRARHHPQHRHRARAPRSPTTDRSRPEPALLVDARPGLIARRSPAADAAAVGTVATRSRFYGAPIVLWVEEVAEHAGRRWGRVELPYVYPRREGWIPLRGLARSTLTLFRASLPEQVPFSSVIEISVQ